IHRIMLCEHLITSPSLEDTSLILLGDNVTQGFRRDSLIEDYLDDMGSRKIAASPNNRKSMENGGQQSNQGTQPVGDQLSGARKPEKVSKRKSQVILTPGGINRNFRTTAFAPRDIPRIKEASVDYLAFFRALLAASPDLAPVAVNFQRFCANHALLMRGKPEAHQYLTWQEAERMGLPIHTGTAGEIYDDSLSPSQPPRALPSAKPSQNPGNSPGRRENTYRGWDAPSAPLSGAAIEVNPGSYDHNSSDSDDIPPPPPPLPHVRGRGPATREMTPGSNRHQILELENLIKILVRKLKVSEDVVNADLVAFRRNKQLRAPTLERLGKLREDTRNSLYAEAVSFGDILRGRGRSIPELKPSYEYEDSALYRLKNDLQGQVILLTTKADLVPQPELSETIVQQSANGVPPASGSTVMDVDSHVPSTAAPHPLGENLTSAFPRYFPTREAPGNAHMAGALVDTTSEAEPTQVSADLTALASTLAPNASLLSSQRDPADTSAMDVDAPEPSVSSPTQRPVGNKAKRGRNKDKKQLHTSQHV
ncbi:hypothetical protein HDU67_000950, partial [Dinochytrium kinnereticum]